MKKNPSSSVVPRPSGLWRACALGSVVINLGLAAWLWRSSASPTGPAVPPPSAPAAPAGEPWSRELRPYAAIGSFMAENNRLADLQWTEAQFAAFLDGMRADFAHRGVPLDDEAKALQAALSRRVQAMLAAEQPNPTEEYFKTLREKEGVTQTGSGLHYRITEPGYGPPPGPGDAVVISFTARQPDGKSLPPLSRVRVRIAVKDLLPGLAEGVQLLRVGGKGLFYLPPALSFTEENWPPKLPRNMPLVFFVELHEIEAAAK